MRKVTKKPNLVIVHSFPTNSFILDGLISYLTQWFTVYFIDLAGFTHQAKQLKTYNMKEYAKYLQEEIEELKLSSYSIMGISFGFFLTCLLKKDAACHGVIAVAPFIGKKSLRIDPVIKNIYVTLLWCVIHMNKTEALWNSAVFIWLFPKFIFGHQPQERTTLLLQTIRGKAFFETAYAILTCKENAVLDLHQKYVLVLHTQDKRVRSSYIQEYFENSKAQHKVFYTSMEHFPKCEMDADFFSKHLSTTLLSTIQKYLYE